jgi:hypothetical protein
MTSPVPFIVHALPRSRTFWLSRLLTHRGWTCGHDEARHVRSLEDVKSWLSMPLVGSVETAAAPWWRLVQQVRPDIRTVVVRRPVEDVILSLLRTGVAFDAPKLRAAMIKLDRKLDQIEARVPGCLSVTFDALAHEATCARIYEHCLQMPSDPAWIASMSPINLQVNLPAAVQYCAAFGKQMDAAAGFATQAIRAKMMVRPLVSNDFTFQQESLETLLRDGAGLIDEHLVTVGERSGSVALKNLPLLRILEQHDVLHITTARQNGRMFGYLLALKAPSLESDHKIEGLHTSFFTSAEAPGLGLKLQRASIEFLRGRGVDAVSFRAGVRGSGPRMGAVYRRLGAVEDGQLYSLNLKEAV